MSSDGDWKIPAMLQPKSEDYSYDLDRALSAVVGIHTVIPQDAHSAETLGTERSGNGILIRENGLVLTIGYLLTEADSIWITLADGRAFPGHVVGYDQPTGFGLVQALARLDAPVLPLGASSALKVGDAVVVGGAGGRAHSIAARVAAKQEFAGYWEYLLDEALFTTPAHPNWGGTAVISPAGELVGVGSLQVEQPREEGSENLNMVVPIDLLKPILDDMLSTGQRASPPRPWLGVYCAEVDDRIVVVGLAKDGPAQRAKLRTGDVILSVSGKEVETLADLFRSIWAMGTVGAAVPLLVYRDGSTFSVTVTSSDRTRVLKKPRLH
ncbi:MAG TPA: S1C family serine protease [Xanthobacteraceae bacterium]|jgi:S1-C subfamily serine protease|nr:S1C family serine protease [Xanthobacteraceae bacterium]